MTTGRSNVRPTQRRTRSHPAVRPAPGAARRQGRTVLAATLGAALFLAGCSTEGPGGAAGRAALGAAHEVHLQPVAAQGPDPFTSSTARGAGLRAPQEKGGAGARPAGAPGIREVTGSTPGLYGGTRAESSCDVEQQVAYLAAEPAKLRAFAEAAGIPEAGVADWLRELTPVLLRADTRVTNHGFRDGRAAAFQSVLQAGTAVLVDPYGAPRVRCACGNPLRSPVSVSGAVHQGDPWSGFDPDRVIIVKPTTAVVTSLVIVNVSDDSWIERKAGSDGDQDRKPDTAPDCDPDTCVLTDPVTPDTDPGTGTGDPDAPAAPKTPTERPASPKTPATPAVPEPPNAPDTPAVPDPPADPDPTVPDAPSESHPEPDAPHDPYAPADPADPYEEPPTDPYADPYTDPHQDPYTDPYADPYADPDGQVPGAPEPTTFAG
ncbi:DUF6777 domain-containing protein [Streptomyces roseolus]|uniref:DUF6777 domain-containing protein n=1 Tax=Streptomyces roseolus TaxID=67358 RepID=UPI0036F4E50C